MIAPMIRRAALIIHIETGRSLQETLEDMSSAARGGLVKHRDDMRCVFCASALIFVASVRRIADRIERHYKCRFCGTPFRSVETIPSMPNQPPPVAEKKKRRHRRDRGG